MKYEKYLFYFHWVVLVRYCTERLSKKTKVFILFKGQSLGLCFVEVTCRQGNPYKKVDTHHPTRLTLTAQWGKLKIYRNTVGRTRFKLINLRTMISKILGVLNVWNILNILKPILSVFRIFQCFFGLTFFPHCDAWHKVYYSNPKICHAFVRQTFKRDLFFTKN